MMPCHVASLILLGYGNVLHCNVAISAGLHLLWLSSDTAQVGAACVLSGCPTAVKLDRSCSAFEMEGTWSK